MDSLKNILKRKMKTDALGEDMEKLLVMDVFQKWLAKTFGQEATKEAEARYIRQQSLAISVKNSSIASEIKMREAEVLAHLHEKTGSRLVLRLRFVA
ncbi:MAG: DUF721 domain-containing protein [Parcubacteria group bacterium]|nr:DUF721 domain-containing protein [Parcubacteria group bacterium]